MFFLTKPFYKVRPIKDLRDLINQSTELYGDRPAFEIKNSKNGHFEITYKRYRNEINCLGTALTDMGLAGEKIAVAGDNCYEWCLSYMATVCGVGVVVPIDRELLFDDINSILNVADVKLLICDGKFASKLDGRRAEMKDDLTIVYMRNEPSEDSLTVAKLIERGQALLDSGDRRYLDAVIDPEAMCSLLFTSGTTGASKGVMLCHRNFCSEVMAAMGVIKISPEDCGISMLPLHHTYESTIILFFAPYCGAKVTFCDGFKYVLKNMKFIFDKTNQSYFHRLYDKTFREGGWRAVPRLTWHMIYRNKRLDDNGPMGASLITLNQRHPDDAFQKYIETTNHHIMVSEPRLADGTIARLWPHENTIWADDAFMAVSFISRMGEVTGEKKYFDDAANQILNYTRYLWCPEKQIYYHCYHTDNKEHGVAHWSRANGWIFMATADLLARMPENHPMREDVIKNFQMQASGVARYQGKNGLWHQLLDKEDSYEEITGSSMFVFGIAKGVKEGWLHPDFIYVAWQGFKGMLSKISENGDVTAICVGTGIMPSTVFYYNRPTQENDPMGEGPVLRALVEMIDAPKYTEISANDQYDKIK